MNSKQRKTLQLIFREPVSPSINWNDVEKLLLACGCVIVEGGGSRVRFIHGDNIATFHRPHPDKTAKRYQIRDAREFLTQIGVEP